MPQGDEPGALANRVISNSLGQIVPNNDTNETSHRRRVVAGPYELPRR
jgi:hypothetical protein